MLSKTLSRVHSGKHLNQVIPVNSVAQTRLIRIWKPEVPPENISQPTKHRLPVIPTVPTEWMNVGMKTPKTSHETWRFYGEEKTHNRLILGQYGIVAISAGAMKRNHFEFIRNKFNKYLEAKSSFAIFRVDAPYKPLTSKQGKRF